MMSLLRKILTCFFTAVYIAVCPLIIMYAFGYLYRPGGEEGLVRTGLIYISTAPEGATVYLNGSRFTGKTPTILRGLLPGNYAVRLMLKGYGVWGETIPVEAEKATVLDSVLLFPDKWPEKNILAQRLNDIVPLADSGFFLAKASDKFLDIFVFGYGGDKGLRVVSPYSSLAEEKVLACFAPEKEASSALFVTTSSAGKAYVWADIAGGKARTKDVTYLFQEFPDRVEWRNDSGQYVFVIKGDGVDRVDVREGIVYPDYLESIKGFGVSDNYVYSVGNDGTLTRMSYDTKDKKAMAVDAELGEALAAAKGPLRVIPISDEAVFFLGANGELLSNKFPHELARGGVRGLEYCPERKSVFVFTKDALGVIDLSGGSAWFEEKAGPLELVWVYKGRDIRQAFWAYQGAHIVLRDRDEVFLVEVEAFGCTRATRIVQIKDQSSVFYVDRTGQMFYLDRASGNLMAVNIVPPRGIMPAPLTEWKEKIETIRRVSR